jgi:zinc protease
VTIADVRQFYAQFYGASVGEIVITGQFDKGEAPKLLEQLFGNWKSNASYTRILSPYRKVTSLDRRLETPDKQNAMLIAGVLTKMSDDDPDYPAMQLANYMLGGTTGARLFKRIRDKEGLSYSVASMFNAPTQDDGGQFMAYAIAAPQNTPKAEASLKDELTRTYKDGFTAEEVAAAKIAWKQERLVGRSQDAALAGLLLARARYDRTLKYDEDLEAKVAALTPQQVTEAFRKHVDLSGITYVKAGDFKKANVYQQ